jgi:CRISPR/Cas system endoribonuclease Cas6 (RAMP superfamily)
MEKASGVEISNQNIWRYDYQRWTNRQKKKLRLDGMLGEIEFENEDFEEFMPFLILGEFLHIGSSSSFGLGKFEMF